MGAVFAFGVGSKDFIQASPIAIAEGMRLTFLSDSGLMFIGGCVVFAGGIRSVAWPADRD